MSWTICVDSAKEYREIWQLFRINLDYMCHLGLNILVQPVGGGKNKEKQKYILFFESKQQENKEALKNMLAKIIAQYITDSKYITVFDWFLRQEKPTLSFDKRELVKARAIDFLKNSAGGWQNQYNYLVEVNLAEYLNQENWLNINGFIYFRLTEYLQGLKIILQAILNEEKYFEQEETFIGALQDFIGSRPSKRELLHVIFTADAQFNFLDEKNNSIFTGGWEEVDLLIETLLKELPAKLVLHISSKDFLPLIYVLKQAFKERVTICTGCKLCQL